MKYLGIYIDQTLSFRHHATRAAAKAIQSLSALSYFSHNSWGIPASIAHHLTMTAILPNMLWASPVWWTTTETTIETLNFPYHRIARWITGLPPNTRTTKLLTCANLPPLNLYLDYLSTRYAIRLHFLPKTHALHPLPTT